MESCSTGQLLEECQTSLPDVWSLIQALSGIL
jgi:hypothetical protein